MNESSCTPKPYVAEVSMQLSKGWRYVGSFETEAEAFRAVGKALVHRGDKGRVRDMDTGKTYEIRSKKL